jgi:hypothetical protein
MSEDMQTSPVTLKQYTAMSMPQRRRVWIDISDITEEEFDAYMDAQKAREAVVPRVGREAPDFVADVLGPNRQRTGEQVKLSALRGGPVGLIFGSFT